MLRSRTTVVDELDDVRRYVTRNFAWTDWHPFVQEIRIGRRAVEAVLSPHVVADEAKMMASEICAALSGWVYDQTARRSVTGVRILTHEDRLVLERRKLSEPCR